MDDYKSLSVSARQSIIKLAKQLEAELEKPNRSKLFEYLVLKEAQRLGVGEFAQNAQKQPKEAV